MSDQPNDPQTDTSDDTRPAQPRLSRRLIAGSVATGLAFTVLGLFAGAASASRGEPLPGVHLDQVGVARQEADQLRDTLDQYSEGRADQTVTVALPDGTTKTVTADNIGMSTDIAETQRALLAAGRDIWWSAGTRWMFGGDPLHVDPVLTYDEQKLADTISSISEQVDTDPSAGAFTVTFDDGPSITVADPTTGVAVDKDSLTLLLRDAFDTQAAQVTVPTVTVEPRVTLAQLTGLAATTEQLLSSDVHVTSTGHEDRTVALAPSETAALLSVAQVESDDGTWVPTLKVTPEAAEKVLASHLVTLQRDAANARLDVPRKPFATEYNKNSLTWAPLDASEHLVVSPHVNALKFDATIAADSLTNGLQRLLADVETQNQQADRSIQVAMEQVEPDTTTEELASWTDAQLLSSFTTEFKCCPPRSVNIRRMADMIDGVIVPPSETFSINETTGPRTIAKGFKAAPMILRGKLVPSVGGGVSQFGTTMLNAAWFSGVEIVKHKPHSWPISRYPLGREATLNYPDIDVVWTNTTDHPILIKTAHTDTSVTVSFYGKADVKQVAAAHGGKYRWRDFPVEYVEDKTLEPGEQSVEQHGARGFDIKVKRIITRQDGSETVEEYFTRYVPEPEIIHRNTDPVPSEEPADDTEDSSDGDGDGGGGSGETGTPTPDGGDTSGDTSGDTGDSSDATLPIS